MIAAVPVVMIALFAALPAGAVADAAQAWGQTPGSALGRAPRLALSRAWGLPLASEPRSGLSPASGPRLGKAPKPPFAERARLASHSLLVDVTAAGQRLVAVGERGHVVLSDDRGNSWVQADSVPARALLTGVCFSDPLHGVAVGHDEVILTTRDAGRTWTLAHFAPESQQPLLDVACVSAARVIAVGAYGAYFTSADGGATWVSQKFSAKAAGAGAGVNARAGDDLGRDLHLNRIVAASSSRLYIAAEGGRLYRSDDGGDSWHELPSPYEGSFFGVTPLGGDVVLACGLRGNLFRSEDAGVTWRRVETGTHATLNDAVMVGGGAGSGVGSDVGPGGRAGVGGSGGAASGAGSVAVVGLSGVVLVSHDSGKSFVLMQQDDRKGLSAAMDGGGDALVVVGEGGAKVVSAAIAVTP